MPKDYKFTNVALDAETRQQLDTMAAKTERSRTNFIKLLINQEWNRQQNTQLTNGSNLPALSTTLSADFQQLKHMDPME